VRTPTPIQIARLAPFAVAGILMTACGPTSTTGAVAGGGGGSGSQPASGGSGSTTSVTDGIGHPVNVCSLVPASTAASVSGEPITVAQEQDTLSYKIYSCNYTSADGTMGFVLNVLALDAAAGFQADIDTHKTVGSPVTPISGLGDKAFSVSDGVEALFGNVEIDVSNLVGNTPACETLIKDLQPKL
jgi:hypothetical protein